MADLTLVTFRYTNYKGETAVRRVRPIRVWFGSTGWHPEAQWLLEAFDLDRGETRDFALRDIRNWERLADMSESAKQGTSSDLCSACRCQHVLMYDSGCIPSGTSVVKVPGDTNLWTPCAVCGGSGYRAPEANGPNLSVCRIADILAGTALDQSPDTKRQGIGKPQEIDGTHV